MNLSEHDYGVKMRHAEVALERGESVKLGLKFRGREMGRQEEGHFLVRRMIADLSGMGMAETEPTLLGKSLKITLSPLPPEKRVRKFLS